MSALRIQLQYGNINKVVSLKHKTFTELYGYAVSKFPGLAEQKYDGDAARVVLKTFDKVLNEENLVESSLDVQRLSPMQIVTINIEKPTNYSQTLPRIMWFYSVIESDPHPQWYAYCLRMSDIT